MARSKKQRQRTTYSLLFVLLYLLSCLLRCASTTTATTSETTSSSTSSSSSLLLLCTADGKLYSLDAWTGKFRAEFSTQALVSRSSSAAGASSHDEDDDNNSDDSSSSSSSSSTSSILPGLDGRLYWQEEHDDEGTTGGQPSLQALPLTIHSVLEQPVKSCNPHDDTDCGILTGTLETSLLALDETGQLLWHTDTATTSSTGEEHHHRSTNKERSGAKKNHHHRPTHQPLLLQRKNYRVQHVSTRNGMPAWNITLGTWQALDFDDDDHDDSNSESKLLLPGRREEPSTSDTNSPTLSTTTSSVSSPLPAIVFGSTGRMLIAVHPETQAVLWKTVTPSIIASVFGMHRGRWKTLQVLEKEDIVQDDKNSLVHLVAPPLQQQEQLPAADDAKKSPEWSSGSASALPPWIAPHRREKKSTRTTNGGRSSFLSIESSSPPNGAVCVAGDCPNLQHFPRGLPSPTTSPTTVQPDGLLLSWSMVAGILTVLIATTTVGGRLWYLHKKRKWIQTSSSAAATNVVPTLTATASLSLEGSSKKAVSMGVAGQRVLTRSVSVPGALGEHAMALPNAAAAAAAAATTTTVPPSLQKDDEDEKEESPLEVTTARQQQQQQQRLPLVRYSRYASEFNEIRALGKGGFGSVFCCQNVLDGRDYAVKKVSIRGKDDASFQQRLERVLREVRILAVLEHPHIVRYYTAWLELEEEGSGAATVQNSGTVDDEANSLSRCYSSSLLTDSVSQWYASSTLLKRSSPGNPMGWKSGLLLSEEPSLPRRSILRSSSLEDCGFIFEASEEDKESKEESTDIFDRSSTVSPHDSQKASRNHPTSSLSQRFDASTEEVEESKLSTVHDTSAQSPPTDKNIRHTLYIQMQLCTQRTVADFLSDPEARKGPTGCVDIPKALRLFLPIAEAVTYVHERGLIHRDLKPQNCFMDESGNVKVGDFGLSRESSVDSNNNDDETMHDSAATRGDDDYGNDDHTAGVGTRSYASPEQMSGSDYDSSTDVYSLGIMLFELCYPMYTGMERNICLSRLRSSIFPSDWDKLVGSSFPSLQNLVQSMLRPVPGDRPSAASVAEHIRAVLSEFTLVSLDETKHQGPGMILLRIEGEDRADALGQTIQAIHECANAETGNENDDTRSPSAVRVVQYGLRTSVIQGTDRAAAIMEFALEYADGEGSDLVKRLQKRPEIFSARQVSTSTTGSK